MMADTMQTLRRVRGATLLVLLAVACGGGDAPAGDGPADGGTAVVCLPSQPRGLNPFTSPDLAAADLLPVLFTPLVRYGQDAELTPWLATEWRWSDDQRAVTFQLRDDLAWHDGTPLTAEDVAFSIRAAADEEYAYWSGEDFQAVEEVTVTDGAVEVRYAEPVVGAMEGFAWLPILPSHLLGDLTPEAFAQSPYHRDPVGSGPYRLTGQTADGALRLERVAEFPAELGRPSVARLLIRPVIETATQLVELRTGGVDACVAGPSAAEQLQGVDAVEVMALGPVSLHVLPVRNDRPPFDDVRVRRALSAALDRAEIAQLSSSLASPAGTFMPRSSPFRSDSLLQPDNDPELAAALLDSAGWTPGPDGVRTDASGQPLAFQITGPQQYRELLTLIQGQLAEVGVDVELRLMDASSYFGILEDPETRPDAMVITFSPTKIRSFDPYSELHSEGYSNLGSYAVPQVDSLVELLGRTADSDRRGEIYRELQRRVAEDVPVLYLVYVPRVMAVGPGLEGVEVGPEGPFDNVMDWRVTGR